MMTWNKMIAANTEDAELVNLSRTGNRDAFEIIVARYQALICSLAYSATGSLGHSENLAQETFITAWTRLADLREPQKLRSWLCGIARNLIKNHLHYEGRQPVAAATPLTDMSDTPASDDSVLEQVIGQEEETILWRALSKLPETYREPMILFYRQGQSIEATAAGLDLSEDAVKQRLARGRKLLTDAVTAMVETTLRQSTPRRAFTLGVMAAVPMMATTASAASVATMAAQGGTAVKSATLLTILGSLVGPLIGLLGAWIGIKTSLNTAKTPNERAFVIQQTRNMIVLLGVFALAVMALVLFGHYGWKTNPGQMTVIIVALVLGYVIAIIAMALRFNRNFRLLRQAERARHPELFISETHSTEALFFEYRSKTTFLGWPLLHICSGAKPGHKRSMAKGWIAVGDIAIGGLFAMGGISFGGISIGGLSVGLCAFGGCSCGLITCAGVALGIGAIGGMALGWVACGGLAIAWKAAFGGAAIAGDYAVGGAAFAHHFNDSVAQTYLSNHYFLSTAKFFLESGIFQILCWIPMLLVMIPFLRSRKKTITLQK